MGNFFGSVYCWFEDYFGIELANYLWGQSSPEQQTNLFIGIGLSLVIISLFMVILFYYIIDHPRFANWWGWSIFLGINAVINFLVGWQIVLSDYYEWLMVKFDPVTNQSIPLQIDESNIISFGVSNMILSVLVFIIFTYLLRWWSPNVSNAPF